MGRIHKTVLILGEGPTEFYYFKSLNDVFKGLTIQPDYPKHTNLKELERKIKEGIGMGYDEVCCVIDMDNKHCEPERSLYAGLKRKYEKTVDKPKKGIHCKVRFYETHRCTELFFLYYFCYTSRSYADQARLLKDLRRHCEYHKTDKFFSGSGGLHSYFERKGGSLTDAIRRAEQSVQERREEGRNYTYSELGRMMKELSDNRKQPLSSTSFPKKEAGHN